MVLPYRLFSFDETWKNTITQRHLPSLCFSGWFATKKNDCWTDLNIPVIKVPLVVRNSTCEHVTSSGEPGLVIKTNASPKCKWDRTRRTWSKHPLLDSRTRCKCSIESFRNSVIRSKSEIRSSSVSKSRFWSIEGDTVYGHATECQHSGEINLILFDEIPISTIELPKRRFQIYPARKAYTIIILAPPSEWYIHKRNTAWHIVWTVRRNLTKRKYSISHKHLCFFGPLKKTNIDTLASAWLVNFRLLLCIRWTKFEETWQKASTQCPVWTSCFCGRSANKDDQPKLSPLNWPRRF